MISPSLAKRLVSWFATINLIEEARIYTGGFLKNTINIDMFILMVLIHGPTCLFLLTPTTYEPPVRKNPGVYKTVVSVLGYHS